MGIRQQIEQAKQIPDQLKWTTVIATGALLVALLALTVAIRNGVK